MRTITAAFSSLCPLPLTVILRKDLGLTIPLKLHQREAAHPTSLKSPHPPENKEQIWLQKTKGSMSQEQLTQV